MTRMAEHVSTRALDIASRVLAAGAGGYALATTAAIALAAALPLPHADAVMTGILLTFALYVAAIMWSFAAATAMRAWLGIGVAIALSWLVIAAAEWSAR